MVAALLARRLAGSICFLLGPWSLRLIFSVIVFYIRALRVHGLLFQFGSIVPPLPAQRFPGRLEESGL